MARQDGFVCKLRPDGSALVFCTYFGTNDFNIVRDIDIDPQGNVYIASSAEADFPAGDTYFNGSLPAPAQDRVGLRRGEVECLGVAVSPGRRGSVAAETTERSRA